MKNTVTENLNQVFRAELSIEQEAAELASSPHASEVDLREAYSSLSRSYSKLLRETMKMTRLNDRVQHKLIKLQEELKAQYDIIQAKEQKLLELNKQLMEASITDSLTGLKNRRYLSSFLTGEVERLNRIFANPSRSLKEDASLLFMVVDIDHFKSINDRFGHPAGDEVLRQFAEILSSCCRASDFAVRWGGEEFLLVCRDSQRGLGRKMAERLRQRVEDQEFHLPSGTDIRCTCSIGFSYFPFAVPTPRQIGWEEIVDLADQSLYAAKKSGRNAWVGALPTGAYANCDPNLPLRLEQLSESGCLDLITSLKSPDFLVF
ncbi:Diguanylate cyclase [Sulfidibacter corallicola]|uniref:diguanylate cyclase n=1 Tax=Sulfidibacter corallicola TaxID=2818388 RepID=A0A8A4TNE9_SULCO|nr:GGDEF domain-containing protein [Sulfidibacter corallicola]QTD51083.1 diguanylate cyclase [Sulfidibacter corallicola]